jgi:membrane protein implicated in regulation of membrane protease activity
MANQLYDKIWYVDTAGMLTRTPVWINAVTFVPNAVTDLALFHYWLSNLSEATSGTIFGTTTTGTITNTDTLTLSAGTLLPSTIADGDFFAVTKSDGSANNYYDHADKGEFVCLVKTAGNNTVVVVQDSPWTNESTKKYTWKVYTGLKAISLKQPTLTNAHESKHIVFPNGGIRLPNLACETMSASAYCLLYLK